MSPTDTRIAKLVDYTNICLSTLGSSKLSLALLKPLIEDGGLRAKNRAAGAFIAHQHLANTLLGSILTEAISISEGKGCRQASLWRIRDAIDDPDVVRELKRRWSVVHDIVWNGYNPLDSSTLDRYRARDAARQLEQFQSLRDGFKMGYDDLRKSDLYGRSKSARDKILAHKDTWKNIGANAWTAEWFDRFGLGFPDLWVLCERLGGVSTDAYFLLTRNTYALNALDQQSQEIAIKFWDIRQCEQATSF